jgi:hypothetical protein
VILFTEEDCGLDFVSGEIAASPDDIAVATPFQASVCCGTAFHLPFTIGRIHLLESSDAIAAPLQPLDLLCGHIGVNDDTVSVLAVADDNDAEFVPEGAQVPAITAGDGDVVERHSAVAVCRWSLG